MEKKRGAERRNRQIFKRNTLLSVLSREVLLIILEIGSRDGRLV